MGETSSGARPEPDESSVLTRRDFLRGAGAIGALTATGTLLGACGSSRATPKTTTAPKTPTYGGNLTVGLTGGSATDTLDGALALSYIDGARLSQLYNPLLQLNHQAQIEYQLAEEI